MNVSAATVERDFLTPAMDARAENLAQLRVAAQLSLQIEGQVNARRLLLELVVLGKHQGELLCKIAGAADQLVSDCRNWERFRRTPEAVEPWSARKIGRVLRDPLSDLCNPAIGGVRERQARALVEAVIVQVPTVMLLSQAVHHELRDRKYRMLEQIHAGRTERTERMEVAA